MDNKKGRRIISYKKQEVDLIDIVIPQDYQFSPPKDWKIKRHIEDYRENGWVKSRIIIDKNDVLKDGYSLYLAYVELGIKKAICIVR